jgi:predicted nucleic acid-binding protein
MPLVVVYDANVLYPSTLRDVLIRVGLARLVRPKWTEQILDEVFRNLRVNRPDLDPARLARTRDLMNASIRDVTVTGFEHLIGQMTLPDPDDRHVLAAAIHAGAQVIVTKNLRDFPAAALTHWGVEAQHPDAFLMNVHQNDPQALGEIVETIARAWGAPDATPAQVIDRLAVDAPDTAKLLRASIPDAPAQIATEVLPQPTRPVTSGRPPAEQLQGFTDPRPGSG